MANLSALYQTMRVTAAWRDRLLFTSDRSMIHRILDCLVPLLWLLALVAGGATVLL